jgi:RNA polymerase sigma factor (sigma-70 family)
VLNQCEEGYCLDTSSGLIYAPATHTLQLSPDTFFCVRRGRVIQVSARFLFCGTPFDHGVLRQRPNRRRAYHHHLSLWNFVGRPVMSSGSLARAIPDEELASRFQATGDPRYFAELFERHHRLVYCACRRFFAESSLAEDATQETFLRAYQAIGRFQQGNVCGWLMRIARNVCIDLWRKQRPEVEATEVGLVDPPEPVSLERLTEVNRAMERVHKEMQSLSPDQRRCLEMKMEGYSYQETAQSTGLSLDAVKSHLQNGRRMLWVRVEGILSRLP